MAQELLETSTRDEEGSTPQAKIPTLKDVLSQYGVPDHVYSKLVEIGVGWNELLYIESDDLKVLCGKEQLNLSFTIKLKFKAAIKQIQLKYKPQKKPERHVVAITMEEEEYFTKLKRRFKNTENVQILFLKHFNEIEDCVKKNKSNIDHEFNVIIANLNKRKQSLYKQIEEWKLMKLENINKEMANITDYQQEIKVAQIECDTLLTDNDYNSKNRQNKVKQIINQLLEKHNEYEKLFEYIDNNTKLMDIKFASKISTNIIAKYGEIDRNCANSLCEQTSIKLNEIIERDELINGYKVKLKWQTFNNSAKQQNDFIIKYVENDEKDDEKKENVNNTYEWRMMDCKQIKCFDDNIFEVDANNILKYDKLYKYKVALMIEKPINIVIKSNIRELMIKDIPPKGNVIQIPLQYHSHRAHAAPDHPRNLLGFDDKEYASASNQKFSDGESDWIIFKFSDLYFPTKFVIKNYNNSQGISSMIVLIGDGKHDWISFNSNETINVEKTHKYQSFSISGIDYKLIKNGGLKHIKIEAIKNHGQNNSTKCRFCFRKFQLHGIKF